MDQKISRLPEERISMDVEPLYGPSLRLIFVHSFLHDPGITTAIVEVT